MTHGIPWEHVWAATAAQLDQYRGVGLANLLTEDVVRFATIQQLVSAGVSPTRLEPEWRRSGVPDAVDLVVAGPTRAAIEFKYPREPRETNAAWTQHLGEALKDFYRLADMPSEFSERWSVQLLSNRMTRYLDGVADRHGVRFGLKPGEATLLEPARIRALPATAHKQLSRWVPDLPTVRTSCRAVHPIGNDLRLVVHAVEASIPLQGRRPAPIKPHEGLRT